MTNKFLDKYYNQELFMIGALDCFGVPHTPDNVLLKSYIDMLADTFTNEGLHVNYINMHSIGCNKTWVLRRILDADYTKKEYYDLNLVQSIKAVQTKDIFPFPLNPNFLTTYYQNPSNPDLKITSAFAKAKNPLFFYSCGQMNMHHYLKIRTGDIRKILPEIAFRLRVNLDKTLDDVREMLDYIIRINPSVTIYLFGVYPMFESEMVRKVLAPLYKLINEKVKALSDSYDNVNFVDVIDNIYYVANKDCHPNFQGQCYMKEQVLQLIRKEA